MSVDSPPHAIVLFDGVCNLCHGFVRFVVHRDPGGYFRFAPLQSEAARRLLAEHGVEMCDGTTLVLIQGGRHWTRSDATLRILRRLSSPWQLLGRLSWVPRPLRDRGYDFVARRRVRWFGRKTECPSPSPELRSRFLAPPRP